MEYLDRDIAQQSTHNSRQLAEYAEIQYTSFLERGCFPDDMVAGFMQAWWEMVLQQAMAANLNETMAKMLQGLIPDAADDDD